MRRTYMFALAFGLALTGQAAAQTAPSDAGATALAESLSVYFGKTAFEKKVVTVMPEGTGYRITFAPNAAIAPLIGPGSKFEMAPYSILAAERADGNWDVSSSDAIAFAFDMTVQGNRQTADYKIDAGPFTGVYSPKLGGFLSGTASYPGATMDATDPGSVIKATIDKIDYEMSAKDVGEGAVDATVRQNAGRLVEDVSVKADPAAGTPDMSINVTLDSMESTSSLTGFKSRAILDLWAFAVAHADADADKSAVIADQEELRRLLNAALPIWNKLDGRSAFGKTRVSSAFGTLSMQTAALDVEGDGISTSGAFVYGLELAGLSVQSALLPAWVSGLVPEDISVTFKLDDLDLETPAKRAIAEFDLSKDPVLPTETSDAIALAFSENPPRLTIEPSRLKSRDFDVTLNGDFVFAGIQPEMNMTIEAAGLDKVISTLQAQAATEPSINEVVGGLSLAKGFAKALPDGRSQWVVSTKADGSVILNGNMLVPPTAETGPAPTDENALPTEDPAISNEPSTAQ